MNPGKMRIGHGYDVHRFAEQYDVNKPLILAGVAIDEQRSLLAHSDGDLILHAICDAILGAMAEGDIGQHFPDSDPRFSGIPSTELLQQVMALAEKKAMELVNIDVTVVAQVPKLSSYRSAMVSTLAALLSLPLAQVNLKATTTEGLGPIGREEGMACHAITLMCCND